MATEVILYITITGLIVIYVPRFRLSVIQRVKETKAKNINLLLIEVLGLSFLVTQLFFLTPKQTILTYLGLFIFLIGILFTTMARFQLKNDYVPAFSASVPKQLITNGAYRLVRHPIYLGMLFVIIGFELVFEPLFSIIGLFTIFVFVRQVNQEEKMIAENLPNHWKEFTQKTKYKLIPFVW